MALMISIVGVYGAVSCDTSRKTREIGIRMALGAQPMDVVRMIEGHGLFIVGASVVVGLGAMRTDPMVALQSE
jgi:putative ABC transport system permease protein